MLKKIFLGIALTLFYSPISNSESKLNNLSKTSSLKSYKKRKKLKKASTNNFLKLFVLASVIVTSSIILLLRPNDEMRSVVYIAGKTEGIKEMHYYSKGPINERMNDREATYVYKQPVVASPEHGRRLAMLKGEKQYIAFKDATSKTITGMIFQAPRNSTFMKPNLDTMLIVSVLNSTPLNSYKRSIDIGSGSNFIAIHMAKQNPSMTVTAIDIDPKSKEFSDSIELPSNINILTEDANKHLNKEKEYDLLVSNPPYIPTEREVQKATVSFVKTNNFWGGIGLIDRMFNYIREGKRGCLIILVTSATLKAKKVQEHLIHFSEKNEYKVEMLLEREIAYKAWFAGNSKVSHLMASKQQRQKKGEHNMYVGLTKKPRIDDIEDGRKDHKGYHWNIAYVLRISKISS